MKGAILCRRIPGPHDSGMAAALLPADQEADETLRGIAIGDTVAIKIARDRSLPQHRLFWAVLQHVAEASRFETPERLLVALKVRLGRYDLCKLPSGKAVPVPQSISFAAMDQDEFARFFYEAINVVCAEVLDDMNPDDLIREVCAEHGLPRPTPGVTIEPDQPREASNVATRQPEASTAANMRHDRPKD